MSPTLLLFAQSLLIGLSIAAPVGQIGVLAIQRTLQDGRAAGVATGLGAALADAVYGAIGAYGVSAVTAWLLGARQALSLAGAAFLLWLAWRTARAPVATVAAATRPAAGRLLRMVGGTFVLTLSNPSTILSFVAVFGVLAGRAPVSAPWVMVAGVLVGSALWWLLLAAAVGAVRERFDMRWQRAVNALSAAVLAGFALWQLLSLLPGTPASGR
ncbi:LysE/ArgO family amino acid transporter [Ideonella sp.]|uniref:LysE/ArgO family amino acid transporter n=1 Tax=Ideonella sp. TaxID=1929293 RepID=UPI0035ADE799